MAVRAGQQIGGVWMASQSHTDNTHKHSATQESRTDNVPPAYGGTTQNATQTKTNKQILVCWQKNDDVGTLQELGYKSLCTG
jgi:hypothetical protein